MRDMALPLDLSNLMSNPTSEPTISGLLCIKFQYSLGNELNLTASDIFNEVNNTLKSRLIIATEVTVTNILNASFPSNTSNSNSSATNTTVESLNTQGNAVDSDGMPDLSHVVSLQQKSDMSNSSLPGIDFWNWPHRRLHSPQKFSFAVEYATIDAIGGSQLAFDMVHVELNNWLMSRSDRDSGASRNSGTSRNGRRLVYYTSDIPPSIDSIADAPLTLCPGGAETEMSRCTVVASTVCIVLGPDDDAKEVRYTLVQGLGQAIGSGEFEANIPGEI